MGPVAEALVVVALGLEELAEVRLAVDVVVQRGVVRQTGGGTKDVIRNVVARAESVFTLMPSDC